MKKILAIALCIAMLSVLMVLPVMAAPVQVTAPKGTPVIDGKKDDGIYGPGVVITVWRDGTNNDKGAWGTVFAAWDEANVYYYMEVIDTTPNHDNDTDWACDCVEMFIDWFSAQQDNSNEGSPYWQLRIHSKPDPQDRTLTGAANQDWSTIGVDAFPATKFVVLPLNGDIKNGYVFEIAIAIKDIDGGGMKLAEGVTIPVDFAVGDNQDGETRDSHAFIAASDDNDQQWQYPTACNGLLVLTAANPPPPNVDASAAKGEDSADAGATGADSGANAGGSDTASAAVKPQAPKTGDAGIIALSVVMIIAAAGIVILRRKAVK